MQWWVNCTLKLFVHQIIIGLANNDYRFCAHSIVSIIISRQHRVAEGGGRMRLRSIYFNPLDVGRRSTDFAQTPYAAGSLLTDGKVYERSGW